MTYFNYRKKGFTLVELSIVLVIIGLLIGGILAAQSMISTSRVITFTAQIQQYDAAIANFQTKYNGLPGDSSKFNPIGDDDGLITDSTDPGGANDHFSDEIANFWKNLADGTLQNVTYSNSISSPNGIIYGTNIPAAKINSKSGILVCNVLGGGTFAPLLGKNVYAVASWKGTGLSGGGFYFDSNAKPSLTPAEALAIDTKMDDGIANTGNVAAFGPLAGFSTGLKIGAQPTTACANGATYNLTSSATPCALGIAILSQNGQSNN